VFSAARGPASSPSSPGETKSSELLLHRELHGAEAEQGSPRWRSTTHQLPTLLRRRPPCRAIRPAATQIRFPPSFSPAPAAATMSSSAEEPDEGPRRSCCRLPARAYGGLEGARCCCCCSSAERRESTAWRYAVPGARNCWKALCFADRSRGAFSHFCR
jgi:hypothetical protein